MGRYMLMKGRDVVDTSDDQVDPKDSDAVTALHKSMARVGKVEYRDTFLIYRERGSRDLRFYPK